MKYHGLFALAANRPATRCLVHGRDPRLVKIYCALMDNVEGIVGYKVSSTDLRQKHTAKCCRRQITKTRLGSPLGKLLAKQLRNCGAMFSRCATNRLVHFR